MPRAWKHGRSTSHRGGRRPKGGRTGESVVSSVAHCAAARRGTVRTGRYRVRSLVMLSAVVASWGLPAQPTAPSSLRAQTVVFRQSSDLNVGDKGEYSIDVSRPPPVCGRASPVFDSARIEYRRRRFGDAAIVATPPSGCSRCPPMRVRWFHEPTGYLEFTVIAQWRFIEGRCDAPRN